MLPLPDHSRPIPRSIAPAAISRETLVLVVLAGDAHVVVDGRRHPARAGQALLVRAGVEYSIVVAPGGVAMPILVSPAVAGGLATAVSRVAVPSAWADRLIYEFVRHLGFLQGSAAEDAVLRDFSSAIGVADGTPALLPPMPRSPEAFEVAQAIVRDPAAADPPARHARRVGISERTLQRHFATETGLSFTAWRTRARVAAAAALLGKDRNLGWVADQVGFGSVSSLVRAFRQQCGMTPGQFRARVRASWATDGHGLAEVSLAALPASAPPIPASETWPRVNRFHVAVWVYRGAAHVEVAGRARVLRAGSAMILPAGAQNRVRVEPGSLLLPVGFQLDGASIDVDALSTTEFDPADETYLLHRVVATYSPLQPPGFDPTEVFDEIVARSIDHGRERPGPAVATLASRLADDLHDSRGLDEWARHLGVDPARLREDFRLATGAAFPRWRAVLRMTRARDQLTLGVPAPVVARNVGYAHQTGFSRAFRSVHGVTPQEFLAEESARRSVAEWRQGLGPSRAS